MPDVFNVLAMVAQDKGQTGGLEQILPMLAAMGLALYFIVLRPEKKQRKERENRINAMKKGDRVVSAGGIHGKVVEVDTTHRTVRVEVASKTVIKFNMGSISTVETKDSGKTEKDSEEDKKKS